MHNKIPTEDIVGRAFGFIVVTSEIPPRISPSGRKERMFSYTCGCGASGAAQLNNLRSGNTTSCGCKNRESLIQSATTHGCSKTKLYGVYRSMNNRCYRGNSNSYVYYGGRGIKVCEEWRNSFEAFKVWAESSGYNEGLTLERTDVNGDYCPENCTWLPKASQALNKRKLKNNKSGVTGVYYSDIKSAWIAFWRENGEGKSKTFSVSKYGEGSKLMAISLRREKELLLGIKNND